MPWIWYGISQNPNITWDIIINNPDKPWRWCGINQNPNITWDIIINNPDKPWDWNAFSFNKNISWNIIKDNPNKQWNWYGLSKNPNILKPNTNYKSEFIKWWHSSNVIKRYWFMCNTNPEYAICKKRLLNEYKALSHNII